LFAGGGYTARISAVAKGKNLRVLSIGWLWSASKRRVVDIVCAAVTNWAMERRRGAGAGGVKTVQWLG
jgi:hypothetical protein